MTLSSDPVITTRYASRRALMVGALGGLGAWAAGAVGRASPVGAADGDVVHVGESHTATATTYLLNNANSLAVLAGESISGGHGVVGGSDTGYGVWGVSNSSNGVSGKSTSGRGVYGESTYLEGVSGTGAVAGVVGFSDQGYGVMGVSGSGIGGAEGAGVYGEAGAAGVAMRANGRIKADKVSGVATIAAGLTRVTVSPGVDVTSSSFVLLTPRTRLGGRDLWFTTNATADTITIRISSTRSKATKIAWLLLG